MRGGLSNAELISILWQARNEKIGLLVRSDDPEKLRMAFYAARREANEDELDCLQFRITKDFGEEGNLLIVKGEKK